ncbi:sigma-54-dependent Fis family transcriptional regulator [Thalassotalea sp. LPB0316]|uniref:sigma-54-dependent transcriptional regulator n=1 Tax=Thalassotalea sp. LPB0316 TaxID=2769490 RepID=UPI001865B297|nr:sigma-54 dependent transcriptional regulator [Thalassotalea sp. LPB0316]QOL25425.1 sigma-54-dependent Fis family transcriptional regulator [Thalassotalea sp. LPB0316]
MSIQNNLPLVIIVDDEREICSALKRCLIRLPADIQTFTSPRQALRTIKAAEPSVIISDQRMPDIDGYALLQEAKALWPDSTRIMLSAYQDFDQVSKCFNEGIIDKFIAKPWKNAELIFAVESVVTQNKAPKTQTPKDSFVEKTIIGDSLAMQHLKQQISLAAGANVPIFINGETGTGKELVANACHRASARQDQPFVAVNCANFSENLIEAQLFGAVKGAYTGAVSDSQGIFAQADGGTVFLDEITTLPLAIQAKLLRVLQEREYTPLGSHQIKRFDTQIVSASAVRLSEAVSAGQFREDLFYRLNVIPLSIPPLREREMDKLELAKHFLTRFSEQQGKSFTGFSDDAVSLINQYAWPGNVRQLENTIHGVCIMNSGQQITKAMLDAILQEHISINNSRLQPENMVNSGVTATPSESSEVIPLADVERRAIEDAIAKCQGNITQAAALLQVNPSTIYRKMQKW